MKTRRAFLAVLALAAPCLSSAAEKLIPPIYTVPGELEAFTANGHPQGATCSEKAIYVTCSRALLKLDWTGRVVKSFPARSHLGDIAYANGRIYGAYGALENRQPGETPLKVGVWDEELNFLTRRFYTYPNGRGFDSCVVLGDTLYVCVDHHWDGKGKYHHPPHCDNTVMMLSLEDLSVKGTRQIVFDYPIHFSTQTLGTDGTHLLFGNYGARYEEGNVKGLNFSRATTDFRLLESRKFLASEGFFLVPPSIIRRETPVFMNVVSLGGNMQGWWRDPKGNPARIRFDYWAYDRQTGEMTNITDYSAGSGYPETIFIEEKKPLTISAAAWKKGASDCVSATYSVPEIYRDFRGYDRVAVDYVNDSGEAAGTPLQAFVSGKDGHVNRGLPAIGGEVPAKGYRRWIFSLENWDKAVAANPADVHRIHFYLYRPQAVNLRLYRITLLPKGAACPPPAEPFKKKILAPMGL